MRLACSSRFIVSGSSAMRLAGLLEPLHRLGIKRDAAGLLEPLHRLGIKRDAAGLLEPLHRLGIKHI